MTERITICICTKDRPGFFVRMMQSLVHAVSTHSHVFRVLIIDSSVSGGTEQYVRRLIREAGHISISYFRIDSVSTSYARNVAVSHITTPYIGYVDDDVELNSEWTSSVVAELRGKHRPKILFGAINPATQVSGAQRIMFDFVCNVTPWVFAANAQNRKVIQAYSANLIIRKDVFLKVGLFNPVLGNLDPQHSHSRGEDAEWLFRAGRLGIMPIYVRGMTVTHHIPGSRVGGVSLFGRFVEDGKNRMLFEFYGSSVWDMRFMHGIFWNMLEETLATYKRIFFAPASLPSSGSWSRLSVMSMWLFMNTLFFCGETFGIFSMGWRFIVDNAYYAGYRRSIELH